MEYVILKNNLKNARENLKIFRTYRKSEDTMLQTLEIYCDSLEIVIDKSINHAIMLNSDIDLIINHILMKRYN